MTKKDYLISVVIPAYNAERYIQRAVDSVLMQTYPAHGIIVMEDGSMDNTSTILSGYGSKIINIRQANAGASVARNTGIERATGNWIAFLDADDEWLPRQLEMQVEVLSAHPGLMWSYTNYWFIQHDSGDKEIAFRSSPVPNNSIVPDYLAVHSKYCIRTSAVIINKDVLYESGLFLPDQKWVQDTDIFLRIAYKHPEIGYIHSPLANYYCDTPESLTSKYCFLANELCILVERHLLLSQEQNRQEALIRCMSEKIPHWVNVALQYKQCKDARIMIRRLGYLIPFRRRAELATQAFLPYIGTIMIKIYFLLKRSFKKYVK